MALTVAGRRFRPYIFVMAMFQLPLMPLMRHPFVKGSCVLHARPRPFSLPRVLSMTRRGGGGASSRVATPSVAPHAAPESRYGNYFFWFGMLLGIPLLCVLYAREHYNLPPPDLTVVGWFLGICFGFVGVISLIHVGFSRNPGRHAAASSLQATAAASAAASPKPVLLK